MSKEFTIRTQTFPTKSSAKEHFTDILNSYEVGERLSASDENDVVALIEVQYRAHEKIGCGIDHISVH